jgi:hypothetical protein
VIARVPVNFVGMSIGFLSSLHSVLKVIKVLIGYLNSRAATIDQIFLGFPEGRFLTTVMALSI